MIERIRLLFAESVDMKLEKLQNSEMIIEIAYLAPLCEEKIISDYILVPFTKEEQSFREQLETNPRYRTIENVAKWQDLLLRGNVLIEADGVIYSLYTARIISNQKSANAGRELHTRPSAGA